MSSTATKRALESTYFDQQAAGNRATVLDDRILQRYANPGSLYPREFVFSLLGSLAGKRILDVGCGEGQDAILLARLGGHVTGVDISEGAIRLARQRFSVNGQHGEFYACAVEDLPRTVNGFDVVFVEALLHHVLHDLESILRSLGSRLQPGGIIIMSEPVDLFPGLRRLRLALGTPDGTPDERPLRADDLAIVQCVFPAFQTRFFRTFGRLNRFLLPSNALYECLGFGRRRLIDAIALLDAGIARTPFIRRASSVAVMWWRRPLN